ncbi:MAG: hypothetical protein HFH72_09345 [Lachnospiraceae bacterium]|nr:hypothetical protein [Lachnospiraceae bacterium]
MTREETVKIIRIMVDSYPNYKPNDISETVDVWQMMLEEYSYQEVSVALKAYILSDDSGFAPSIGKLVSKIHTMTQPQELNEMEAWSLVSKAIRNSGYNSVEEFAKLPLLVQKAVGLPDQLRAWALNENYNEEVVSSNFIKCYRNELARQRELQKMPQSVRNLIEKANVGSYSAGIAEKRQQAIESAIERKQAEIKALEMKHEGIPMPERYKERLEDMRNE